VVMLGLYPGSTQLKSRQGQQLSRLRVIVVVLSPVKGQDSTQATSFHILCNYHSAFILCDAVNFIYWQCCTINFKTHSPFACLFYRVGQK
jgi:hypothetical protein